MSNLKVSELPAAGLLDGSEVVPIVQAGASKKTTAKLLRNCENLVLSADAAAPTTTNVNVGNLAFDSEANATYLIDALVTIQSAAATTGVAFSLDIPAGASCSLDFSHPITTTTKGGSYSIADDTPKAASTAVPVITENCPVIIKAIVKLGATPGPIQLRMRSEIAASQVTAKADLSVLQYHRVA